MKMLTLLLSPMLILFSNLSVAANADLESALAGCAAIKDSKKKLSCYDAVTKLSDQAGQVSFPSAAKSNPVRASRYANFSAEAKRDISRSLKDPSSAQWQDLFVSRSEGGEHLALCGEMNARNSYGGYTGFKRFFWVEGAEKFSWLKQIEDAKYPDLIDADWKRWCNQKLEDVPSDSEPPSPLVVDAAQKKKWIVDMAQKNGCEGVIRVAARKGKAPTEYFQAECKDRTLEFTCEFVGEITESPEGIPTVSPADRTRRPQPACWK